MATELGRLEIPVHAGLKDFGSDIEKAATEAGTASGSRFGDAFSASAQKRALKAGAVITAALAAGLGELDNAAAKYQAQVGASAEETARAKQAALDLFKVNRAGFDDILGLMAKLRTDQGLSEEQTNRLAQAYLTWARIAGGTAVDAATSFDDVQDAWNLTAEDSVVLMDKLVASNQQYGGSLQARVRDLAVLAPALKGLGLTVDDAIALENAFESAGLDASAAQRALTSAIKDLKPGQTFDDLVRQIAAIEDPTLRAQKAIELFGSRGAGLANVFKPGTDSLAEFGVAADDAAGKAAAAGAAIDSSVPRQFELFLHNLGGTLLDFVGDAGPIALTIASVAQLGVAFDLMKVKAILSWAAAAGPGALVAGAALIATLALVEAQINGTATANNSAALAAFDYTGKQRALTDAHIDGTIADADYERQAAALDEQYRQLIQTEGAATGAIKSTTTATEGATGATGKNTDATGDNTGALVGNTAATGKNEVAKTDLTGAALAAAQAAEQHRLRLLGEAGAGISAAQSMNTLAGASHVAAAGADANVGALSAELAWLNHVAFAANVAARNLAAMGHVQDAANAAVRSRLRQLGEDPGVGASASLTSGGIQVQPFEQTVAPDVPFIFPKKTGGGGGGAGGKSQATKDAEALAKAVHDEVVAAYERMKEEGNRTYDAIHAANSKAITDQHNLARASIDADHKAAQDAINTAHRVANERIDTARRAVDKMLADQLRLNAAPVTAAEKALRDRQQSRQLASLQKQLQQAQASGDQEAAQSISDQISDFMAEREIDTLRAQQQQADEIARNEAVAAKEALDVQQATEDALYEKQKADEDAVYQARVAAEDGKYKDRQHDEDTRAERQKKVFDAHIAAMEDSKRATVALANAETKRFLQEQLKLAREHGTAQDVKNAADDLKDFVASIPKHELGLPRIPRDDYLMFGHKDEAVLPAYAARSPAAAAAYVAAATGRTDSFGHAAGNQTINVYNPAPEPAGRSVVDTLKLRSAFGG